MAETVSESGHPLAERYASVRARTLTLCAPLAIEDYGVQPIVDASPPKWHLAHTTWFFETFLLKPFVRGYRPYDERFEVLFNSYYNGIGKPWARERRGHLSRPTVATVLAYRRHVDAAMSVLANEPSGEIELRLELGLQHEQQHQELILTDLKYNLGHNPLAPAYRDDLARGTRTSVRPLDFETHAARRVEIGAHGDAFCFDNETPRHEVLLPSHALADRLITNGEYLDFIVDGGYQRPDLWLADGWTRVCTERWSEPLYWRSVDGVWLEYRLSGLEPLARELPVAHLSAYEADAYARWRGCRLPTEFEWEASAGSINCDANFQEADLLHPRAAGPGETQRFGDLWEWTSSSYSAYPGYRPLPGTLGEYNGKFMSGQLVLRGGSCATPAGHARASYRNFFYPGDRWQFTGLRLARDVESRDDR
jgi:ergothioneine biosynthesis protein EgtB